MSRRMGCSRCRSFGSNRVFGSTRERGHIRRDFAKAQAVVQSRITSSEGKDVSQEAPPFDVAIVRKMVELHSGSVSSNFQGFQRLPILSPAHEKNLPFAVSLEVKQESADHTCSCPCGQQAASDDASSAAQLLGHAEASTSRGPPLCELLFFLQGTGQVHIVSTGQVLQVSAGDSILVPAGDALLTADVSARVTLTEPSAHRDTSGALDARHDAEELGSHRRGAGHSLGEVEPKGPHSSAHSGGQLALLRVVLPVRYVLEPGALDERQVAMHSAAVAQATAHWHTGSAAVLNQSALHEILAAAGRHASTRGQRLPRRGTPNEYAAAAPLENTAAMWRRARGTLARAVRAAAPAWASASPLLAWARTRHIPVEDAPYFQLPEQGNRLALVLDPVSDDVPFTFGIEVFPTGHCTPPHVHPRAHEMFFILAGDGEAFCNGTRFPVTAGDTVVFPPGCEHGVDVPSGGAGVADRAGGMYCLELMVPNEEFAEFVRTGQRVAGLDDEDMCVLAAVRCGG